jgi:predicted nucleic acid-binding protein
VIFLDTSAIFALSDRTDLNHTIAIDAFRRLLQDGEDILTHSYVLVEATALLQRRLGVESALGFLDDSKGFEVHWMTSQDHEQAVALLAERKRRGLSLVDCASFLVMRRHQVNLALAFDTDFEAEGFLLYRA